MKLEEIYLKAGIKDGRIWVKFKILDKILFFDQVDKIKTLPGAQWDRKIKVWWLPLILYNVKALQNWNFEIADGLLFWASEQAVNDTSVVMDNRLRPFQCLGVQGIDGFSGQALLADEQGLGKTVQSIAWLGLHSELRPVVCVVPSTVKINWARHVDIWLDDNTDVYTCSGTTLLTKQLIHHKEKFAIPTPTQSYNKRGFYIINYDILQHWLDFFYKAEPKVFIADECHYLQSGKAKRTKAVKALVKNCNVKYRLGLTGTPIANRPKQFFSILNLIRPDIFNNELRYNQTYCGPKHNGFGWTYNGASNTKQLHDLLYSTLMIRRLKKDVLKELPDKTHTVVPFQLSDAGLKEYNTAENNFLTWLAMNFNAAKVEAAQRAEALVKIGELKRLAARLKYDQTKQWIEDFLQTDEQLVVFTVHHEMIDKLADDFKNITVTIDGRTPQNKRQEYVDMFQRGDKQLFIGNIKAAGIGINLFAASNVVLVEFPWTPLDVDQGIDRIHRIGQKSQKVTAWYLIVENTIEERIVGLIDEKRKLITSVLDGEQVDESSMLSLLLESYRKG